MGQRSRKRGRRERPGAVRTPERARRGSQAPGRTPGKAGRISAEERNAALRAALSPIAPGERPWAVRISVVIAFALGAVNLGLFIAGARPHVGGQQPHLVEILIFSGLMLMCAVGMWRMRYWALLGFQTLLAIGLLGFCLALVRVSSLGWGLLCAAIIGGGGYLFFKLVRVLSRIQLPAPPGR